MSITITITIPGPGTRSLVPPPRPVPAEETTAPVVPTRVEQVWHTVRPYVPVLLAGVESLVPGLGVVVALAGIVGVRATTEDDRREAS
jgi:hypothetical protein